MVSYAERKTQRTTWLSGCVREEIRRLLADGPKSSSWVKKTLCDNWLLTPASITYHAKCLGVIFEGNSNLTRTWRLPPDKQPDDASDDSSTL